MTVDEYKAIQRRLNELGTSPQLSVDGDWGPLSTQALKNFQSAHGIPADGIANSATMSALGLSIGAVSMMGLKPVSDSDKEAYAIAKRAAQSVSMTEAELQYVLSVAKGEGGYGKGWANPSQATIQKSQSVGLTGYEGAGSNNWGAVQGRGSAGSFPHIDHHADGTMYVADYRRYNTPEEGFLDMARIILNGGKRGAAGAAEIKAAIKAGNLRQAVQAQHKNGYFELDPEKYLAGVLRNYNTLAVGLGWPKVLAESGVTPVKGTLGLLALVGAGFFAWQQLKG